MSSILHASGLFVAVLARDRRRRALVLAVLAAPLVMAAVIVFALAPAFDRVGRLPVAVVNLDRGAVDATGRAIRSGQDLIDSLDSSGELSWSAVDDATARKGLADGTYALILRIPHGYSEDIASLSSAEPERAHLEIESDGAANPLATFVGTAILRQVQSRLKSQIGEDHLISVLSDVRGQATKLTIGAEGASMVDGALKELAHGSDAITQGTSQAAAGAEKLGGGLNDLAQGASASAQGAAGLTAALGVVREQGSGALADGSAALAHGLDQAADLTDGLGSGVTSVGGGLSRLSDSLRVSTKGLANVASLPEALSKRRVSLADALNRASRSSTTVGSAAAEIGDGVRAAQNDAAAAATDSAALAQKISAPEGAGQGMVQDLAELQQTMAYWADPRSRAALADAFATPQDERTSEQVALIERFDADMGELGIGSAGLAGRLADAAGAASDVAKAAQSARNRLSRSEAARGELDGARRSFTAAASDATQTMKGIGDALNDALGPLPDALKGIVGVQVALDGADGRSGLVQATTQLGAGVRAVGAQLGSTGGIGRGAHGLSRGAASLGQALDGLAGAASGLAGGGDTLAQALGSAGQGATGLGTGLRSLAMAQTKVRAGVEQLKGGSSRIVATMRDAGSKLADLSKNQAERASAASNPVALSSDQLHPLETSASQIAPAPLVCALWLGALLCTLVLPPVDRRVVIAGRAICGVLSGTASATALCLIQTAALSAVLVGSGALDVADVGATCAALSCSGIAFALLAQAARLVLRRLAAPVSVAALLLQIVCAGTVLPASLAHGVFAAVGPMLPVPAATQALRAAIAGFPGGMVTSLAVLAVWGAIALAASLAIGGARRVRPARALSG